MTYENISIESNAGNFEKLNGVISGILNILVRTKCDLTVPDNNYPLNGETLLHRVAELGNIEMAKILFEGGMDVNIGDNDNRTPIIHAIHFGNVGMVEYLVSKGADIKSETCKDLIWQTAINAGNVEILKILIEAGADVKNKDSMDMTPLHWAAEKNFSKAVQLLIEEGADPNAVSKFGSTPLDRAGISEVAEILMDSGASSNKSRKS